MGFRKYQRWNASRKTEVALALHTGEPLEDASRATGQPAHMLSGWRESFLEGGAAAFHAGESAKEKSLEASLRMVSRVSCLAASAFNSYDWKHRRK